MIENFQIKRKLFFYVEMFLNADIYISNQQYKIIKVPKLSWSVIYIFYRYLYPDLMNKFEYFFMLWIFINKLISESRISNQTFQTPSIMVKSGQIS